MNELRALVNRLRSRLNAEGVPFVIGGSIALAARGFVRATQDIDVMVMAPDLAPVHRAMTAAAMEWINEVTFRDAESGLIIDVMEVKDDAQRHAFDAATLVQIDGAEWVRVLTPESCCIMLLREATKGDPKKRPLRLRDIEALALIQSLDWNQIKAWAGRMDYRKAYQDVQAEGKPPLA